MSQFANNPYDLYTGILQPQRDGMRRQSLTRAILDNAYGFPYSRKLEGHDSCINTLAFSSKGGRFLASGGDDLRIFLWDFYQDDVTKPAHTLTGPNENIFCLSFSPSNRYVIAGGICQTVYKYDIGSLGTPLASVKHHATPENEDFAHDSTIRALSFHPFQDEIYMSASEDGTIVRHDGREATHAAKHNVIQTYNEVTGVQYHPTTEHLFITSGESGYVCLRDTRMAFGGPLFKGRNAGVVQTYNTVLAKHTTQELSNPEASSVTFDKDGSKLAITFLHYLPTIYALSDPDPIAVLSGQNQPDGTPNPRGERTYRNSCTMKHGSFGGPGLDIDDMYAAGSDDFRGYVWKLPSISQLTSERMEFSHNEWLNAATSTASRIAFTRGRDMPKCIPTELSTPFCRLTGHTSIVNTTLFHPHFLNVVTAGVERDIVVHSPTPSSPCVQDLRPSPLTVRPLMEDGPEQYRGALRITLLDMEPVTRSGDSQDGTLRLFDNILLEEGTRDVFEERRWYSPDPSDEENDLEEDDDDESTVGF